MLFIKTNENILSFGLGEIMNAPILGLYVDYREYLKDFFEFKKRETMSQLRPYSFSDFSASADIKSPNYLKLIIDGQRNLSLDMCKKFGRALKLNRDEQIEFENLVNYGQAEDPLERNLYLKKLSEIRTKKDISNGKFDVSAWEKVPSWLAWVLYAMTDLKELKADTKYLRELLSEKVTEEQIKKALEKLIRDREVEIRSDGYIRKCGNIINEADKIPAALVRKLQAELVYLGLESLHRDDPTERELSGFTLAMTEKEYEWVRFELRKIRKHIQTTLQSNRESSHGDRVYQVNIQLFPITKLQVNSEKNKVGEKKSTEALSVNG